MAVTDWQKFRLKVADTQVGRTVPVVALRDGNRMTFQVKLSPRDAEVAAATPRGRTLPEEKPLGGLAVRALTDAERNTLGIAGGVLVTGVEEGSPADDAGLQSDLVVEEVGGKAVTTPAEFSRAMREAKDKGKPAVLLVRRGEMTEFITVRLKD
jgi:serine protease Do